MDGTARSAQGQPGKISPIGLPWGDASALGVDLEPVYDAAERLRKRVSAGQIPGFLSCLVKDGQLLHFDACGHSDICSGAKMSERTLFRLYSQTKPIVVVGFLRLLERGVVDLEDPVAKYIPAFGDVVVGDRQRPLARQVLVRDLLAHTSGVGFGPGFGYAPENDYEQTYLDLVSRVDRGEIRSLQAWCDEVAKLPLRFQPGKDWGYGYSSDILGRVVEVVSGRLLDDFIQAEVLEPLGMNETFFAIPTDKVSNLAALYKREPWDGNGKNVRFTTVDPGGSGLTSDIKKNVHAVLSDGTGGSAPSSSVFLKGGLSSRVIQGGGCVCSVAGGLISNFRDYARFSQMLVNNGSLDGIRLLKPETVQLLAKDWLNEFTSEKRRRPMWVWGTPGIGFSPLGQIGVEHKDATHRRIVGSQVHTVHWGGAGGSGYMLNWPHSVVVLTYTGCTFDTATQKTMWRAAFGALRRGKAKPKQQVDGKGESAPAAHLERSPGSSEKQPMRRKKRPASPTLPSKKGSGASPRAPKRVQSTPRSAKRRR